MQFWGYRTGRKRIPDWLITAMLQDFKEAGYSKIKLCFESDLENIVKRVKEQLIMEREADEVLLESPVKESQCNGKMERVIQTLEGQIRTVLMDNQLRAGLKIQPTDMAYQYLLNWAAQF